jgi:hypothetical protein
MNPVSWQRNSLLPGSGEWDEPNSLLLQSASDDFFYITGQVFALDG